MKTKLTFLLIIISLSLSAHVTYEIQEFSDKYYGKVIINNIQENEYSTEGTISIFNTKTKTEVIKITSESILSDFDTSGKIKANVKEIPYGEQSLLIYEDFNFDGKKDIAIMDGQNSCYGGPSYQIYLEVNNTLKHSPDFTQLGQEFCGMFEVHKDRKIISTFTKSGCCWHQFSEFKVENNTPVIVKILERSLGTDAITEEYIEKTRVGNKLVEKTYSHLSDEADIIEFYSLNFKNDKKMELYRVFSFEDYLLYTFTDKDNKIELIYSDDFVFNKNKQTLTFVIEDVTYQIYAGGIIVNTPTKRVDLKALKIGDNVSLSSLSDLSVKNLVIE